MYIPAFVSSEASNFSESIWIQSPHDFDKSFMKLLINGAIKREEQPHRDIHEAQYQVLVKAIGNQKSNAMKV